MCDDFTLQKYIRCSNPPNDTIEAAIDSSNIGWCQGEYKAVDHANGVDTPIPGSAGAGDAGRQHDVDTAGQPQVELRQPGAVQQILQAGNRTEPDGASQDSAGREIRLGALTS